MNEQYIVTGTLAESPISEFAPIKSIRNKRHRKRITKKYQGAGAKFYLKPVITWEKQEVAQ